MSKLFGTFILLAALPIAVAVAAEKSTGTESGPNGAGPPGYQSWPGHTMTTKEQAPEKHISAAAAHEQATTHHKAAAAALQAGKNEEAKAHGIAAEQASSDAHERSKEALSNEPAK